MNSHHSSESNEHGSPIEVIDASHAVMGGIDLDPASNALFNSVVEASNFFDQRMDGFNREWHGRVFLNPPGGLIDADGRPVIVKTKTREGCSTTGACGLAPGPAHKHKGVTSSAKAWWFKLTREWDAGRVDEAIFVGFTLEILQTTQSEGEDGLPIPLDFPICIPAKRLDYNAPNEAGKLAPQGAPTHAGFIAYIGPKATDFLHAFRPIGRVIGMGVRRHSKAEAERMFRVSP